MTRTEPSIPPDPDHLARLRAICMALPDAVGTVTNDYACWSIKGRAFCSYGHLHGDPVISFRCDPLEQADLIQDARFFVQPYMGRHGGTCMWLTGRVPWKRAASLIQGSYAFLTAKGASARGRTTR